jgi:hypothetical protein
MTNIPVKAKKKGGADGPGYNDYTKYIAKDHDPFDHAG